MKCDHKNTELSVVTFRNGTKHIQKTCSVCEKFLGHVPKYGIDIHELPDALTGKAKRQADLIETKELGSLTFQPGDFESTFGYHREQSCEAARVANRLLAERLACAPKMRCRLRDGYWSADEHEGFARSTHTGRLVSLEEDTHV